MCGLVSVVGDLYVADKKAFNYMLQLDTSRGPHSTGVARVPNKGRDNVTIVKDTGTPWDLYAKKGNEFFNSDKNHGEIQGDYVALIGHNRWATIGAVNTMNAHPFDCDSIIGAQNGTLTRHTHEKLDDWKFFGTDSEALFHNIDLYGIDAVLPKVDGAWALTYYNIADDTFNFIRNKERPLYYAWKKNKKTLYIASEYFMIYAAAEKYHIDLEDDLVYEVPVDTLYSIKVGNPWEFKKDNMETRHLEGKKYVAPPANTNNYGAAWKANNVTSSTKSAADSANVFTNGGTKVESSFLSECKAMQWEKEHPFNTATYWQGQVGKYAEFYLEDGIYVDEQRKTYIKARTINGNKEIRIYDSTKNDVKAVLGDKDVLTFAARIKRVKTPGKGLYLLIDTDDITDVMRKTDLRKKQEDIKGQGEAAEFNDDLLPFDANSIFVGEAANTIPMVRGNTVSVKEYENAVSCGCAWCSAVPSLSESPDLLWMTADAFLCSDCKTNPEVAQFVQQAM